MALCRAQHHQRCSHPTKCVNGSLFSHQEATDARNHGCQGPSVKTTQAWAAEESRARQGAHLRAAPRARGGVLSFWSYRTHDRLL